MGHYSSIVYDGVTTLILFIVFPIPFLIALISIGVRKSGEAFLFIDKQQVEQEEENIRVEMRQLPDAKRAELFRLFKQQLKDPDTYAALNWSLVAGLHHLYLGKWLRTVVELAVFILGIVLLINDVMVGLLFITATTLLELYELFRSQVIVQDFNNQLMRSLIERHR